MKPIQSYQLIKPEDLHWRLSNLMKIPNADYLERTGSENLSARLWWLPDRSANRLHKHIPREEFDFVLFTNGRSNTWINPAGRFPVLEAAAPVYQLKGAGRFAIKLFPRDGELAVSGKPDCFLREGYHSLQREDWKAFPDFADLQLGRP